MENAVSKRVFVCKLLANSIVVKTFNVRYQFLNGPMVKNATTESDTKYLPRTRYSLLTSCFNVGVFPTNFGSPKILQNKNQIHYLNFSFDTWSCNEMSIWIDSLESLFINFDLWKFCDYKFCGRKEMQFFIYNVTSHDSLRKGSWLNEWEPFTFRHRLAEFVGNRLPLFTTLLSLLKIN